MPRETGKEEHFRRNLIESHLPSDVDYADADGQVLADAVTSFIEEIGTILPVRTEGTTPELWGYREGIWKPDGEQRLRELIAPPLGSKYSRYLRREVQERLRSIKPLDREELGLEEGLIPCSNRIYDAETEEVREYTPEDLATWKLNAEYDEYAECEEFENFLTDALPASDMERIRKTIYEYLAYATQPHTRHQKALFILGPTQTSKSTLLEVVRRFFGEDNDACQSLQKLASNRFSIAELEGKPINVRSDLSSALIRNMGLIKELIAGDTISAERKHRDPFRFKPRTKYFFSANKAPGRNISDEAFWRRWITIPFENQVPPYKKDRNMVEKLTTQEELSGILNQVIEGLNRLREQGFTYEMSANENRKIWVGYGDVEEEFILKYVDTAVDEYEKKDDVYSRYKDYAARQGEAAVSIHKFTKAMKRIMNAKVAQRRVNGTREYCYEGISLREDKLAEVEEQNNGGIPL